MTPYLKALGLFTSFALLPAAAHAGAWTAKQGDTYLKGAINYFDTNSRFGDQLPDFENFRDINFNIYLEHGLRDDLTFFATSAFKDIEQAVAGETVSNSGIGDVDLGLRYNLTNDGAVVSIQGLAKLPFLYSETADLPLGNGQIDLEGKVLVGKSFGPAGYVGLEAGYRYRAEAPVDEFRYLIEYGVDLSEETYFRTKLDGIVGLGSADDAAAAANTLNASLPIDFDLGKLEYTLGYKFQSGLAAEITGTTNIYGDNTLKGTNVQFAIVSQF